MLSVGNTRSIARERAPAILAWMHGAVGRTRSRAMLLGDRVKARRYGATIGHRHRCGPPMSLATTDLSDAHPDAPVLAPIFRDFGGVTGFHGRVVTLKVYEDNALVRATLETPGAGRVLVVDGGGSLRCALVGGMLAELGRRNNWAGIVVYGCVRDVAELAAEAIGIKALAAHPRKSEKGLHTGHTGRVLEFAGARIAPDDWLYADADGVLVSSVQLHP